MFFSPDMNGRGNAYAVYVQDDWKITPNLTLKFWLAIMSITLCCATSYENSAQFLPDYYSNINGTNVRGRGCRSHTYAIDHMCWQAFGMGSHLVPIHDGAAGWNLDGLGLRIEE